MNRYFKSMIAACSTVVFGVAPCDVVEAPEETAATPVVKAENQDACTCKCCGKEAYTGAYIAAGIGFDMARNQALLDTYLAGADGAHSLNFGKKHFNRPAFSLAAGYGDFVTDSFYLGAELGVDFLPNKTANFTGASYGGLTYGVSKLKVRGISPSFAIRLGQGVPCCGVLVYEKLGFAIQDSRFSAPLIKDEVIKTRRITPVIGLGVEKNVCENCNVRLEVDYRLGASRRRTDLTTYNTAGAVVPGVTANIKNKVRGYSVRLMFTYNFRGFGDENTDQSKND